MEPQIHTSAGDADEFDDGSRARRAYERSRSTGGGAQPRAQRDEFAPVPEEARARPVPQSQAAAQKPAAPPKKRTNFLRPFSAGNGSNVRPAPTPTPSPKGGAGRAWEREFMLDNPAASKPGASKPGASKPGASKPGASKPGASKPGGAVSVVGIRDDVSAGAGVVSWKPDSGGGAGNSEMDPASDQQQTQADPVVAAEDAAQARGLPRWAPYAAAGVAAVAALALLAGLEEWTLGPNLFVRSPVGDWLIEVVSIQDASVRERWTPARLVEAIASGEFVDPEGNPAQLVASLNDLQAKNPNAAQREAEAAQAAGQAAQLAADNARADAQAPANVSILSDLADSAGDLVGGVGSGAATGLKVAAGLGVIGLLGAAALAVRGRK